MSYAPTNEVLKALDDWVMDAGETGHEITLERLAYEPEEYQEALAEAGEEYDRRMSVLTQMEQVAGRDTWVAVPDGYRSRGLILVAHPILGEPVYFDPYEF